jgi:three-Cys-motif partner protein
MNRDKLIPYAGREHSSVKHFLLESYLERLIMITARPTHGYDHISYVDAFSGPWQSASPDLSDTSFAKAIEVMERCRATLAQYNRTVKFRALFVERDPEAFARLTKFAAARFTSDIEILAINEDFAESASSVAQWIRNNEMAFVLVDPTGWKDVISPRILAPLLRKRNVEMLINVMWNFINLASGHASQRDNLSDLVGSEYQALVAEGSAGGGENWMRAYLQQLKAAADDGESSHRLRTAWFPVEFRDQDRVFYYLTYVTHHVKGLIVFLEESEKALTYQREMKFAVKQQQREAVSRMQDLFGNAIGPSQQSEGTSGWDARQVWLALLPAASAEVLVDETVIAEMAERCGCLIPFLQASLSRLMNEGILENLDMRKPRRKNFVNYRKGETIRRRN